MHPRRVLMALLLAVAAGVVLTKGLGLPRGAEAPAPPGDAVERSEGARVVVDQGAHRLEGVLGAEAQVEWVLKDDLSAGKSDLGDAHLAILSATEARVLRERYGDFFRCDSPGAGEAMARIRTVRVLAGDRVTRQRLREAKALLAKGRIPVVRGAARLVHVSSHTWRSVQVQDGGDAAVFVVWDLQILDQDLRAPGP